MSKANALSSSCAIVLPVVMNELNHVLSARPEDVEGHVLVAKRLVKELLDQTQRAIHEGNTRRALSA